jgi:MYXO-CTERM domain-containing protein
MKSSRFALAGAVALLGLCSTSLADVMFQMTDTPVMGPADIPVILFQFEVLPGDVAAVTWDLEYIAIAPSTGAQLTLDLVGPGGQMIDLDGSGLLGLPDTDGVLLTSGAAPLSGPGTGMWSLVISDSFQDGGFGTVQGFLTGNVTVTQTPVPAPGALAILGAAGLVVRRRRRR